VEKPVENPVENPVEDSAPEEPPTVTAAPEAPAAPAAFPPPPPPPAWGPPDPWGAPEVLDSGPPPPKDRRVLRAAARWTAAVLVFAALGGAAAYGVTQPRRTDIPGLRTPDDGRWTYKALKLPKLPAGKPGAFDDDANPAERHYADLRELLLPAPQGAKVDKTFVDSDGWLPTATFLELFQEDGRKDLALRMKQNTLRHIAARAWTMPDGTRAEIYLLQYNSAPYASDAQLDLTDNMVFEEAPASEYDSTFESDGAPDQITPTVYDESKPRGERHVRYAFIPAGDTVALVYLSRKGSQSAVPFHPTVLLQSQLLG
jgi:hypothetical protein